MAQEFTINSSAIESKINQLLPSQGGFGAGVDFSASTMVIPIVDLTESAEGSALRQDLQISLTHNQATVFDVANATTTVINTTGYWRIIGTSCIQAGSSNQDNVQIILSDGSTDKAVWKNKVHGTSAVFASTCSFDFNVFLPAAHTLKVLSNTAAAKISGSVRQLADISGNLINPT